LGAAARVHWTRNDDRDAVLPAITDSLDRGLAPPSRGESSEPWPEVDWEQELERTAAMREAFYQRLAADSQHERETTWATFYSAPTTDRQSAKQMQLAHRAVLGEFPPSRDRLSPRTEKLLETDKVVGYRVILSIYPGVRAYGILLVPRPLLRPSPRSSERRAAVICQHGAGGRPEDVTGIAGAATQAIYQRFGERLAEHGYVVFAPHLTLPGEGEASTIARTAALTGRTQLGLDLVKLSRALDFLSRLPFVDRARIGYYGLGLGGRAGLWTAPGESRLAAVVISGHFIDWVRKTTSLTDRASHLFQTNEDNYNFGVLTVFNHADLAAMNAPRPLFIETGEHDTTTPRDWVLSEYARARAFYARLGFVEQIEIDTFPGPHRIWGEASFRFLDRWLQRDVHP
jgi:dienelactone hydrolase